MNPSSPAAEPESSSGRTETANADALPPIAADLPCQECGYNLRGLTSNRCPECGRSLESLRSPDPQIPWIHRKELGLFRAFWTTVWMATYHRKQLCEEIVRPVSFPDSQRFRWVAILHAYVPVLIGSLLLYVIDASAEPKGMFDNALTHAAVTAGWPLAVANAGALMFLAAMTGVMSCFFHPGGIPIEQQNRAIALSYYACGPVACFAIPLALFIGALLIYTIRAGAAQALCVVALFLWGYFNQKWWGALISIAWRTMPGKPSRAVMVGVAFGALFCVLWFTCLVGLPVLAFYFAILINSLG